MRDVFENILFHVNKLNFSLLLKPDLHRNDYCFLKLMVAPSTTLPVLQSIQKQNHLSLLQQEINAKANTPSCLADKAKTGDVIVADVKKLAHSLKQTAQTITGFNSNYQSH